MKKIIALAVVLILVFSLSACGEDKRENTVSGPTVDSNTVEIVENAYQTTEEILKNITAVDMQSTLVKTTTVNEQDFSERITTNLSFINSDAGKTYAIGLLVKSGDISSETQFYSDGKDTYAALAGKTYVLSKNKDTDAHIEGILSGVKLDKIEGVKVTNTTIVDTSTGGHGFVLEYDCTGLDAEKLFGDFFTEGKEGAEVTFTKLTSSGIVDNKGRLTAQTFTLEYTYNITVDVPVESTSSETTSSKKTSSKNKTSSESTSSVATEKVTKNVSAVLSVDNTFNYDIDTLKVPDLIEIGKDADGNEIKHTEISIQDFTELGAGDSDKDNTKK